MPKLCINMTDIVIIMNMDIIISINININMIIDRTCLKNDGHVGRIEQLDGIFALLSSVLGVTYGKINTPTFEQKKDEQDQKKSERWIETERVEREREKKRKRQREKDRQMNR